MRTHPFPFPFSVVLETAVSPLTPVQRTCYPSSRDPNTANKIKTSASLYLCAFFHRKQQTSTHTHCFFSIFCSLSCTFKSPCMGNQLNCYSTPRDAGNKNRIEHICHFALPDRSPMPASDLYAHKPLPLYTVHSAKHFCSSAGIQSAPLLTFCTRAIHYKQYKRR